MLQQLYSKLLVRDLASCRSPGAGPVFLERRNLLERRNRMEEPTEREVMERAYQIWERNGRPEDHEDEFWHQALYELRKRKDSAPCTRP